MDIRDLIRNEAYNVWTTPIFLSALGFAVVLMVIILGLRKRSRRPRFPGKINRTITDIDALTRIVSYESLDEALVLPKAGSYQGPSEPVDPFTQVLVFRAQSFFSTPGLTNEPFEFPKYLPVGTNPIQAHDALINFTGKSKLAFQQERRGGLYDGTSAQKYGFPWPPEAGVQLLQYLQFPDKPVSDSNPIEPASGRPVMSYPSEDDPFVRATATLSTYYQTSPLNTETLIDRVELTFVKKGLVYVEASGGPGGDFTVGKNPSIVYKGGSPGLVWGYVPVDIGDTWYVHLSRSGGIKPQTPVEISNNVVSRDSFLSGGGTASFLSGSEGGGATIVANKPFYTGTNVNAKNNMPEIGVSNRGVFLVGGGGGGASRNACGGPAGSYYTADILHAYGRNHPNESFIGYAGGTNNDVTYDETPIQSYTVNDLSGGSGTTKRGGQSYTRDTIKRAGTYGAQDTADITDETKGKPLQGGTGSNNPPGGGGGGSGFFGGGAGLWNGRRAPNNEHGAGGGGSSYVGPPALFTSDRGYPNGNPFLGSSSVVNPPGAPNLNIKTYNYFMLALPSS